jgi:AraC family transcriptional activator of pobA
MDLDDFLKDKAGCYSIESGFAVWEVKNSEFLHHVDIPEIHIHIFIVRGSLEVLIEDKPITLHSDSLTDILHSRISIESASDDIFVIFIFTTETFLANFIKNKPPFSIEYIMQILEKPVLLLTHTQSMAIYKRLELVFDIFRDETNYHQSDMLKCALWLVYMEISNIFMHQYDELSTAQETDHKRFLFMKFVKSLPLHIREERRIGYYASHFCVSCQYLERVIKMISGQTASQWIQRTLIGEVNHLLKDTDKSIQQIADEFGFPDQATFSKYYKRNVGMTPTDFRSKNIM